MSICNRYRYPAFLCYDSEVTKKYYVLWYDLPGCTTVADTADEAVKKAHEAMSLHLYGMEKDGDEIPEPTPLSELDMSCEEAEECIAVVPIEVYMPSFREKMDTKSVNRTITLPRWLDDAAKSASVNFSQVMQDALMSRLHISRTLVSR